MRLRIPPPPRLSPALNYALAVLLPLAAWWIQLALRGWVENVPFVLFFLAVSLAASIAGWGPGLVSVAASAAAGYAFLSTSPNPERAVSAAVGTAIFVPVAALIAGLGALARAGFHEQENAALELAEAVRARDKFISIASHELKTPLTSLSLVVQQMARTLGRASSSGDPRLKVESLVRHTQRLSRLVDGMLNVSRISSGRMHLNIEDVDLSEVVREVGASFEDADHPGSVLTIDAPAGIVGQWDRMRLEQIATNLLSNAVKYGEGRPILVAVHRRGEAAALVVTDHGMGIPAVDHERIFERFERGQHGPGYSGFGLGLWIVREVATALGGTVAVESAPARGATFTVVLPLAQATRSVSGV